MSSHRMMRTSDDSLVNNVLKKYVKWSELGMNKYGTNLERTDLSHEEWLVHLQEELMDASLYIEKLLEATKTIYLKSKDTETTETPCDQQKQ